MKICWSCALDAAQAVGSLLAGFAQAAGTFVLIATLGITIWQVLAQDKRSKRAATQATAAAERAEAASALTINRLEVIGKGIALLAVSPRSASTNTASVSWGVRWVSGDKYVVRNEGESTAYDVDVKSHPSLGAVVFGPSGGDLPAGSAIEFMAAPDFQTIDSTIRVFYRASPEGELTEWSYPLPAKGSN